MIAIIKHDHLMLQKTITSYDLAGVEDADFGRTWIVFPVSGHLEVDQLYLYNGAQLALEPAVNPSGSQFSFTTEGFYGDGFVNDASKLGTVHVGPHQTFTVRYLTNSESYQQISHKLFISFKSLDTLH